MGSHKDQWQEDQSEEMKSLRVRRVRRGWTGETQEGGGQGFQHVLPSAWLVCAAHLSSSVVLLSLFSACLPRLVSQLNDEQGPGRMYWVLPRCPSLR